MESTFPFPSSVFLDKNRRDIGKSQSIWTASKMETVGSRRSWRFSVLRCRHARARTHMLVLFCQAGGDGGV
eukprot:COSAG01_NODE_29655_length_632_cov_34.425891_1_plen_70_part_10